MVARQEAQQAHGLLVASVAGALGTLVPVAAHQLGLLEHLPDPPGAVFDSDGITESPAAHPLGLPDGVLGLGSFGATLGLALLAPRGGIWRRLLGVKLAVDGAYAGFNVVRQVVEFRRVCAWCTGTALCTAGAVVAGRRYLRLTRGD